LVSSSAGEILLHDGIPFISEIKNWIGGEVKFIIDLPSFELYTTDEIPMKFALT